MKRLIYMVVFFACVVLLVPQMAWSESKPKGNPPVITSSFAVEEGYYGYVWRIYLEAEDPEGDMSRIAVQVDQLGNGYYPVDWIILKSPYRGRFKGYLQWNTFSSRAPFLREWTSIKLKVSVFDKAGNESNEVIFPFQFVSGPPRKIKPPAPFNEEGLPRLGYIHIDLFEPTQMGAGVERDN